MPLDQSPVWPSDTWAAHLGDREDGKSVRDEVAPFPEWWLLMAGQGRPATPEQHAAFQEAHRIITTFTGMELARDVVLFTRAAVRDALFIAPQPVAATWVRSALSIVSHIAQWCRNSGQPLTNDHVFHAETLHRGLHGRPEGGLGDNTIKTYRARLGVIAQALIDPPEHLVERVSQLANDVTEPHPSEDEVALWAWSRGLRPVTRRQRVQGALVLGLGVGARRSDMAEARARDVVRDTAGVHVTLRPKPSTGFHTRTVTCLRAWEDRLWHIAETTHRDHLIVAPWRARVADMQSFDETVRAAMSLGAPTGMSPARLRNTWLVRHLASGTPLSILMAAADISTVKTLHALLDHVPAASADQISAALRQARG